MNARRGRFPAPTPALPYLLFRTTPKDRWLLAMIAEHRVLTAPQITRLCYSSQRRANERLHTLTSLGLVERFRPNLRYDGASPYHYVLGPQGAALVAAAHDMTPKQFGYDRGKLLRQAYRADLGHTLGCNSLVIELARAHQTDHACTLRAWWDQDTCERYWGEHIRPDAYLEYAGPSTNRDADPDAEPAEVSVWLEYDTGSEHLDQVVAKLDGYQTICREFGTRRIILFQLSGIEREYRLHARINATHGAGVLPIATSCAAQPTGAVWQPVGTDARFRLSDLAGHFTAEGQILTGSCEGNRLIHAPAPTPDLSYLQGAEPPATSRVG